MIGPLAAARAVVEARTGGRPVAVVVRAEEGSAGRVLVYDGGEVVGSLGDPELDSAAEELGRELLTGRGPATRPVTIATGEARLYGEAHRAPETLWVVGAGHIAVPLAELGARLGFRVVVLDDREDFATDARFPAAAEVRRVDFADPFAGSAPSAQDYVVLVTRAHRYDFDCLSRLVTGERIPRYVGMVGSRRRVKAAFGALLESGVSRDRLRAVHAPIGLEIGAETPEEIAVSVAAELVAVRRGSTAGGSLKEKERVLDRLLGGSGS